MQTTIVLQIEEQLRKLPEGQLAVVLDFVSYLAERKPLAVGEREADGEVEPGLAEAGIKDYLANLEEYEDRLVRGEIHW